MAKSVDVTGFGAIVDGNLANARKNAIEDAKRLAAEQMLGSYISARTETNNFMLASEKILSTVKGQLDSYRILEEQKVDEVTFSVKISASIDEPSILSNINQQLAKLNWYKKPILKIVQKSNVGIYAAVVNDSFSNKLSQQLKKTGFSVLSEHIESPIQPSFEIFTSIITDLKEGSYQGLNVTSNELTVVTELANAQTAMVLSSSSESLSRAGSNSLKIFDSLTDKLAYRIAQRIQLDTKTKWMSDDKHTVVLKVLTSKSDDLDLIQTALSETVVGLSSLQMQSKNLQETVFLGEYKGWPKQLFVQLQVLSVNTSTPFHVDYMKGSEIIISLKIKEH
ncbi:MAG: hypothetical protein ACJAV1_002683 [Paraglaciecola sp.]|jgi:hypothetical protein